jgi:hypothetical protein
MKGEVSNKDPWNVVFEMKKLNDIFGKYLKYFLMSSSSCMKEQIKLSGWGGWDNELFEFEKPTSLHELLISSDLIEILSLEIINKVIKNIDKKNRFDF